MNRDFLENFIKKGIIEENVPMSSCTTFGVGGPARWMIRPGSEEELSGLICSLSENGDPYFVLGNGSNLLVSDRGYHGVVIDLGRNNGFFESIAVMAQADGSVRFRAGSGCRVSQIGRMAAEQSLTGFEPLSGIPGSVGGAAAMNAGAYGGEFRDVFFSARGVDPDGTIRVISPEEMEFGYRRSSILRTGTILTEVTIALQRGNRQVITETMKDLASRRREKQPLEYPSAGSTFKRPEGYYAGKLIEDAGLRGYRNGGASVSSKHCGFIVNDRGATAGEIYELIRHVQETVYAGTGVMLEPEVRFLGEF